MSEKMTSKVEQPFASVQAIADAVGIAVYELDLSARRFKAGRELLLLLGADNREAVEFPFSLWVDSIYEEDRPEFLEKFERHIAGKTKTFSHEYRLQRSDGSTVWLSDSGRVVKYDTDGKPLYIFGGVVDIDRNRKSEEILRQTLTENEALNKRLRMRVATAERDLAASSSLVDAMFEANPFPNLLLDRNSLIIDCNPSALTFFGFKSKTEFLDYLSDKQAKTAETAFYSTFNIPSYRDLYERLAHENSAEHEADLLTPNGIKHARVHFRRVAWRGGEDAVAVYIVDLTKVKQAQGALSRQDALLQNVNAIAVKIVSVAEDNHDKVFTECLQMMRLGTSASRVLVMSNENVVLYHNEKKGFERSAADYKSMYENILASQGNRLKSGECLSFRADAFPHKTAAALSAANTSGLLLVPILLRDGYWGGIGFEYESPIEYRDSEIAVIQSGCIILVSSIVRNQITENLIEAREKALAGTKAKSEFLSRTSHEIRTPMNAIIGMTDIAKKSSDPDKVRYCLDKISEASAHLLELINYILDMSKIEADKFEIVPNEFNFEKMLQNVINVVQVKANEKRQNLTVVFQDLFNANIYCDELRLSQTITNILNNAVKFTPDEGFITMRISRHNRRGNAETMHIEIQDNGIGISEEQQKRLFKSFEQADGSITRRFGGTGLGLAICKKIVNLMGGDITVKSEPGKGSTFIFDIDFLWCGADNTLRPTPPTKEDIRILVVDDQEYTREYFKGVLDSFSMNCETAASGEDALELVKASLKTKPYDIIFLDWRMPGMSGTETAKEIKRIMNNEIVVVMISAYEWADIESESKNIPVERFLQKPIFPSAMFNTIAELTGLEPQKRTYTQDEIPETDWHAHTVLVAEDIEINREILLSILEPTNINIEFAENGKIALEKFQANEDAYRLILMDIQMPEMDGLTATRKIRALPTKKAANIPIIAMTANAFKEDVEMCLNAGMNDHIAKPIDVDGLILKLSRYLNEQTQ